MHLKPNRRLRVSFSSGILQDFALETTVKQIREGLFGKELIFDASNLLLDRLEKMKATSYERVSDSFTGKDYTFDILGSIPDFTMEVQLMP
jgi:hypothetical protein